MMAVLLLLLASLVLVSSQVPPSNGLFSVIQGEQGFNGSLVLTPGKVENYIAVAQVDSAQVNVSGWSTLDIVTNGSYPDVVQAYAAGYIEGAITTELIWLSWSTQLEYFYKGQFNAQASAWLLKNDAWVRAQTEGCQSITKESPKYDAQDCGYWYQVGLVLAQMDGMVQGYNDHCAPGRSLTYDVFLYLNINEDLDDVLTAINPANAPKTPQQRMADSHCSVLIKYSEETQQLYHAHVTWAHYANMLRTFKHYTFQYSDVAATTVSFSGFPGFIASGDDYFITSAGLIVTETTNTVFNLSLYEYVQPDTVLYWLRVVVANRMAQNGSEWAYIFGKYNSGTYNNQWQVTDTKLFTPGQPLQPETLTILEQVPGFIRSADVTDVLINNGNYFPSYNIPYFPFIYNISGYPEAYAAGGNAYSYSACPRANIFRRDQGKVATLQDMKNIMRYNEYQTDPFSLGNPCNGISSRCDLNTTTTFPFGGLDCKVSDNILIKNMTTSAISGPTTLTQPPFSWTGIFADTPHYGQPTTFNFDFVEMEPALFM